MCDPEKVNAESKSISFNVFARHTSTAGPVYAAAAAASRSECVKQS